jgi:hypothetical protein
MSAPWSVRVVVDAAPADAFARLVRTKALGTLHRNGPIDGPAILRAGDRFSNRGVTAGLPSRDTSTVTIVEPPAAGRPGRFAFTTRSKVLGGRVLAVVIDWSYTLAAARIGSGDATRTEVVHALEQARGLGFVPASWIFRLPIMRHLERRFVGEAMTTLAARLADPLPD